MRDVTASSLRARLVGSLCGAPPLECVPGERERGGGVVATAVRVAGMDDDQPDVLAVGDVGAGLRGHVQVAEYATGALLGGADPPDDLGPHLLRLVPQAVGVVGGGARDGGLRVVPESAA